MANIVHCDGPGCDNTRPADQEAYGWLKTETIGYVISPREIALNADLCSLACLEAWAREQNTH